MDTEGMYVEALVNSTSFVRALCDNGCSVIALVSERFAQRKKLYTFPVTPRSLYQVSQIEKTPQIQIKKVAHFQLDIAGWEEAIFAYVVPGQDEDLILGQRWLQRQDAVLYAAEDRIELRRPRVTISTLLIARQIEAREISGAAYMTNIQRARKRNLPIMAFSASLREIQKAIRYAHTSGPDPHEPLAATSLPDMPNWLRPVLSAFDRKKADELPPHRPGIDHAINLQKNLDGTDKTIPSSPLYR